MKGPFYYPPIGFGGSGLRCVAILDLEAVHAQGLATQTNIFTCGMGLLEHKMALLGRCVLSQHPSSAYGAGETLWTHTVTRKGGVMVKAFSVHDLHTPVWSESPSLPLFSAP